MVSPPKALYLKHPGSSQFILIILGELGMYPNSPGVVRPTLVEISNTKSADPFAALKLVPTSSGTTRLIVNGESNVTLGREALKGLEPLSNHSVAVSSPASQGYSSMSEILVSVRDPKLNSPVVLRSESWFVCIKEAMSSVILALTNTLSSLKSKEKSVSRASSGVIPEHSIFI